MIITMVTGSGGWETNMKKVLLALVASAIASSAFAQTEWQQTYYLGGSAQPSHYSPTMGEYIVDGQVEAHYLYTNRPVYTNTCSETAWSWDWLQVGPCWNEWQIIDQSLTEPFPGAFYNVYGHLFTWPTTQEVPAHVTIVGEY